MKSDELFEELDNLNLNKMCRYLSLNGWGVERFDGKAYYFARKDCPHLVTVPTSKDFGDYHIRMTQSLSDIVSCEVGKNGLLYEGIKPLLEEINKM